MTRFDELSQKAVDFTLAADEAIELDAILADNESFRRSFVLLMELEAALRGLRMGFDLTDSTLEEIRDVQIARTETAVLAEIAQLPPAPWQGRVRLSRRWRYVVATVALAAGVFLAFWLGQPAPTPSDPAVYARVVELSGSLEVRTPDGEVYAGAVGDELQGGMTLRTPGEESFAVVEYGDSTRLELQPDTLVRLATDPGRRIVFSTGVLRTCVGLQKLATPMIVVAPQAEIRAGDACFLIASASPESSRIDLESGGVEVVRQSDGRSFPVTQGSYTVTTMTPDAPVVQDLPAFRSKPERTFGTVPARAVGYLPLDWRLAASYPQVSFWDAFGGETKFTTRTLRRGGMYEASTHGGAVLSSDGSRLAVCTSDGIIHIWDTVARQEIRSVDGRGYPRETQPLAVHPHFVVAPELPPASHRLLLWRLDVPTPPLVIETEFKAIRAVAASPDGKLLAVAGDRKKGKGDHPIWLMRSDTGERIGSLGGMPTPAKVLTFSADSETLAAAGSDSAVRMWEVPSQSLTRTIVGHERPVTALAFSADDRRLAGGTSTGQVWVWDAATGGEQLVLRAGKRLVWSVAFSPDGSRLMVAEHKEPPSEWDVRP